MMPVTMMLVTAAKLAVAAPSDEPAVLVPHLALQQLCDSGVVEVRAKLYKNQAEDTKDLVDEAAKGGAKDPGASQILEDRRALLAEAQQEHADAEALNELCKQEPWKKLEDLGPDVALTLPRSYYGALGVDVCEAIDTPIAVAVECGIGSDGKPPSKCQGVPHRELDAMPAGSGGSDLLAACAPSAGSVAALLGLAVPVAQGLSDFIQARGKEELYDYAIERFGVQVCEGWPDAVDRNAKEVDVADKSKPAALLHDTCKLMFPTGLKGSASISALRNARLQETLRNDLVRLPGRLLEHSMGSPSARGPSVGIAKGLGDAVVGVMDGRQIRDLFTLWAAGTYDYLKESRPVCNLITSNGIEPHCAPLFLLEVTASASTLSSGDEEIRSAIELGMASFCERYGAGDCGITSAELAKPYRQGLHEAATKAARLGQRLGDVEQALATAKQASALPSEQRQKALPALGDASAGAIRVLFSVEVEKKCEEGNEDQECSFRALRTAVLEATTGLFAQDYREVLHAVSLHLPELLDNALQQKCTDKQGNFRENCYVRGQKSDAKTIEDTLSVLAFAVDLSEANDREEAAQIIETAAAERGRYKMKYGRGKTTVTLNAFPGFFGGGQRRFNLRNDMGGSFPDQRAAAFRFSAAVGLDLTLPQPRGRYHVGVFVPLLDPLAITTFDQKGDITKANFVGIISPGAMIRVGLRESPVVLAAGMMWNPLLEDDHSCGSLGPCWRGAIVYGASLVVDVTILSLR